MKRDVGGRLRDGEAFDRLVEEHYDDVLAYCRRHAPSCDEAPDVAQEAFLRFVRSGRSPVEGKPLAYLLTIARNLCIDASRAKRPPAVPLDVDVPDRSPGADPAAACAAITGAVMGFLDTICPLYFQGNAGSAIPIAIVVILLLIKPKGFFGHEM